MSAFMVNKDHIDLLVAGLLDHVSTVPLDEQHYIDLMLAGITETDNITNNHTRWRLELLNADDIGKVLWAENARSVAYRYDHAPQDVSGYRYNGRGLPGNFGQLSPIPKRDYAALIQAISCYDYQSCEHPEWKISLAYRLTDWLMNRAATEWARRDLRSRNEDISYWDYHRTA